MLLSDARTNVRVSVLHVGDEGDNQYDDCNIDRALQAVLSELLNYTRCAQANVNVSLSAATSSVDLTATSGLTYLIPSFFDHARIGTREVRRVDHHWVRRRLEAYPNQTGQPTHIGFETPTLAWLYPKTDAAYTLVVTHQAPLISWTPGTSSAVTLNIPDRLIRAPLWAGVAAYLVAGEEGGGQSWVTLARNDYEKYREEVKAMASVDSGLPNTSPYTPSPVIRSGDARQFKKGA